MVFLTLRFVLAVVTLLNAFAQKLQKRFGVKVCLPARNYYVFFLLLCWACSGVCGKGGYKSLHFNTKETNTLEATATTKATNSKRQQQE